MATSTVQPSHASVVTRAPHVAISRFEVLRPADRPREFWLLTWWDAEPSFRRWHRDHRTAAHQYLPPGLRLVPGSARVESFEHVAH